MKRRGFLQFLGLAPAAVVAPAAAEKFAEIAKRLDVPPAPVEEAVPIYSSAKREAYRGSYCTVSCSVGYGYIAPENRKRR